MKRTIVMAIAIMALGGAQSALAQSPPDNGPKGACAADVAQYCPGLPRDDGTRAQCLKDHRVELSAGCKAALSSTSVAHQACALDEAKYCPEIAPGADRLKCMSANMDKLSDGCKSALSPAAVSPD